MAIYMKGFHVFRVFFSRPLTKSDLNFILEKCSVLERKQKYIFFIREKYFHSPVQAHVAFIHALEYTKKRHIFKKTAVAFLVFMSCSKEINKALQAGLCVNDTETLLISFNFPTEDALIESLKEEGIMNLIAKIEKIEQRTSPYNRLKETFNISEKELKATYAESQEEALLKCILMRIARTKLELL
ncbi:MAG: hypothetical protein DRJ47_08415 [Thermoprotei archaeon]|nr:MAG: hypothetical protein DRJ47_08415 [Thermoprotei archaeon]